MKLKKVDRRYRMYGYATSFIVVDEWTEGKNVRAILRGGFGPGQSIWRREDIKTNRDWYYEYKTVLGDENETEISHDGKAVRIRQSVLRIYFRRDEQATYLFLKMAGQE